MVLYCILYTIIIYCTLPSLLPLPFSSLHLQSFPPPFPLFSSSDLIFSSSPLIQSFPSLLIILYVSALTYTYLYSIICSIIPHLLSLPSLPSSSLPSQDLLSSSFFHSSHSFYTCRYLHILIYIQSVSHQQSDPACFIGVDG